MAKQSLMWTTLPNGFGEDGESLKVSVLLSPRLHAEAAPQKLATFPDFIDWPATVAGATFKIRYGAKSVTIGGSQLTGDSRVDDTLGTPDSSIWKALFPPRAFVKGFAFNKDLADRVVLSYDTTGITDIVRSLYTELAKNATDQLPKVSALLADPGWRQVIDAVAVNDRRFREEKTGLRDSRAQFEEFVENPQAAHHDLARRFSTFQLFHTPPSTPQTQKYAVPPGDPKAKAEWRTYERTDLPKETDFAKEIDFHQIVAAMNQYPTLLRKLGLVVDFIIEPGAFASGSNQALSVTVKLPPGSATVLRTPDAFASTRARLSTTRFDAVPRLAPKPEDYRIQDGMLDLKPSQFRLLQMDPDGAGLKLMNFARSLHLMRPEDAQVDPTTKHEREVGAPALRNAGLMLVQRQRSSMLENALEDNKKRNAAVETIFAGGSAVIPPLFAEELLRGYRIDIWNDKTRSWRSLCERSAEYSVNGGAETVTIPIEEGTVRLAATKSSDEASNPKLIYLHEALVSWTGWSLCVPPVGKTIDTNDDVSDAEAKVPPGIRLETTFAVLKNSLPRLRYGRKYWVRARVVNLAGNSLPAQEEDFGIEDPKKHATPYQRYDPIGAPAIALVKQSGGSVEEPAEGESMERIAIRSFNLTPADNSVETTQAARRFAVPVRTTVRDAEHHGMLDKAGKVDASTFNLLAVQKDETLKEVILKTPGPLPASPAVETTYAVFEEGGVLPYLPDPLATAIVARLFDHPTFGPDKLITIPLYPGAAKWPHAAPFTIRVFEDATQQPEFDPPTRTLSVPLPKAARVTLRLSVRPSGPALDIMGIWAWLSAADRAKLEKRARSGQHWMLTPWRNVELVHAVQKPLIAPEMDLRIDRPFGQTFADPVFTASCSIKSTDRLDLRAEWNEPIDDPGKTATETIGANVGKSDHAFSVKITGPKHYAMRNIDPKAKGVPEHDIVGPDRVRAGGVAHDLIPKHHEFNDTRYRRIEYWLEATTRFREYMPANVLTELVGGKTEPTDKNIKVVGPKVRDWIKSSAPPPAPEVLYVVPTFGWVRTKDAAGNRSSWRRGGGLRVYLDRRWNVSGYGEMLGVVLPPASFAGNPEKMPAKEPYKSFITQWGNDPIWTTPSVGGLAPKRASFPLSRTKSDPTGKWLPPFAPADEADQPPAPFEVTGLRHPALVGNEGRVEVAPHDVFYDEERRLWYCDIEVDTGTTYYPFIRLALARYQPVSVFGAHLSPIVLADFMPLVSERWLNVTQTSDPRVRRVSVFGHSYTDSSSSTEAKHAPSRSVKLLDGTVRLEKAPEVAPTTVVEVWVEGLNTGLGEDFGWQRATAAVVQRDAKGGKKGVDLGKIGIGVGLGRVGVGKAAVGKSGLTKKALAQQKARAGELLAARRFDLLAREGLLGLVSISPTLWRGMVMLPQAPSPETRFRLVIAEYEEYLVDDERPYDPFVTKKDRRLVFVEHVELS